MSLLLRPELVSHFREGRAARAGRLPLFVSVRHLACVAGHSRLVPEIERFIMFNPFLGHTTLFMSGPFIQFSTHGNFLDNHQRSRN